MGFVYGPEEKVASDATPVFRQEEGGLAWATVKSKGICVACERFKKSQTAVDLAPLAGGFDPPSAGSALCMIVE